MPPLLASVVSPTQFEEMREKLNRIEGPESPRLSKDDWLAGLGVFLLVVGAMLPLAFIREPARAMRISNAIAIVMLLLNRVCVWTYSGRRPWAMGMLMVIVGGATVGFAIALGG
jgi:hypothetical protein